MNKLTKIWLPIVFGAVAGYAYYSFIGCRSGTCVITGNPVVSTFYGGLLGFLISEALPIKRSNGTK